MPHSYLSNLMHCVFSTKERRKFITPEMQQRLWPFIGGIAKENGMKALAIGGVADHVHVLLSLPATMPVAKALQLIKGGSSKFVHKTFPDMRSFAWQEGYGAFSISLSHVETDHRLHSEQAEHHQKKTFEEEFRAFLQKHRIEYDEQQVWG